MDGHVTGAFSGTSFSLLIDLVMVVPDMPARYLVMMYLNGMLSLLVGWYLMYLSTRELVFDAGSFMLSFDLIR